MMIIREFQHSSMITSADKISFDSIFSLKENLAIDCKTQQVPLGLIERVYVDRQRILRAEEETTIFRTSLLWITCEKNAN